MMNRRADRGDDEGSADGQQGGCINILMKIEGRMYYYRDEDRNK